MSYQQLTNKFLAIENKISFSLFVGVLYLQTRFFIFRTMQNIELKSKRMNSRILNKKYLFLEIVSLLVLIVKLPILLFKKNIHIFVEHARYQKLNHMYVEPYSFLSQNMVSKNGHYLLRIGTIKNGMDDIKIFNFNYLFVSQYQYQLFSIFIGILLLPLSVFIFYTISRKLSLYLPSQIFSKQYFLKLLYYTGGDILALIMLFILKPVRVGVTESYNSNSCFILAANILKIKSYEFQHGIISNEHVGYNLSYKDTMSKEMFLPKHIYVWSKDWKDFIGVVSNDNVKLIPWTYEYFHEFIKIYDNSFINKSIDILIIGQPSISDELKKITLEMHKILPDKNIVYKAHPKEIINDTDNIKLTICRDDLYELLLNSQVVIGGFSTALLEAKSLGCNVISLKQYVPYEYQNVLIYFSVVLLDDLEILKRSVVDVEDLLKENSKLLVKNPVYLGYLVDNLLKGFE